ncbi:LOW QUALITY PROTEIN: uncharacterized protein LOC124443482 [Xenia sp. Carnegie-2017]|uniref:LOW QUALITY PROTEIN: uncharacterized protein LOC124443482 n=1 Tax=Xenia sp. Carnegie-2017 TaxID=2897299 RepID=UPI001F047AB3|nr:LOW QUALITY PROTEIN: uncharacterized protein LOC124443482 [Xenia sp. Carnegie-2017]
MATSTKRKRKIGRMCCAISSQGIHCPTTQYSPDITLHYFPDEEKDLSRRQAWTRFIRKYRPFFVPSRSKSSSICSLHFEESCFSMHRNVARALGIRIRLKKDAIPTIDVPNIQVGTTKCDKIVSKSTTSKKKKRSPRKLTKANLKESDSGRLPKQPVQKASKRKLSRIDNKPRKVIKHDPTLSSPEQHDNLSAVKDEKESATSIEDNSNGLPDDKEVNGIPVDKELNGFPIDKQVNGFSTDEEMNGVPVVKEAIGSAVDKEVNDFPVDREVNNFLVDTEFPVGPQAFGLVPVSNPISEPIEPNQCKCRSDFDHRFASLEKKFTLLQNKHDALQQSHDKLSQLVEAQNYLLTCYSGSSSAYVHASSSLVDSPSKKRFGSSNCESSDTSLEILKQRPSFETPDLPPVTSLCSEKRQYILPKRATACDILHLWEDGNSEIPPVKNWPPSQKNKVQSKLGRWKRIVDIFKIECDGNMDLFQEKYSNDNGDLLPVTTILALNENKLSSDFLSKGYCNVKQDTIELSSPQEIGSEKDSESSVSCKTYEIPDDKKTNRYVLPRRASARDVVHLWEYGCDDFPPLATWTKAQKIGQETKIFRWKKIVELFKNDCNSNWDLFYERYSNDNGELLPLATILSKLLNLLTTRKNVNGRKIEQRESKNDDILKWSIHKLITGIIYSSECDKYRCYFKRIPLECPTRKYNCLNVSVRRKSSGFGITVVENSPVKRWSSAQKLRYTTKLSRWRKIADIFHQKCNSNWRTYEEKYPKPKHYELLALSTVIAMQDEEQDESFQSTTKPLSDRRMDFWDANNEPCVKKSGKNDEENTVKATEIEDAVEDVEDRHNGVEHSQKDHSADDFDLPKKVTALDIINYWENGFKDMPPVSQWTRHQKFRQRGKIARWSKLYAIYEKQFNGNLAEFNDHYSDEKGQIYPVTTIISMYESQADTGHRAIKEASSKGPVVRKYNLPRKVDAKDIINLWEKGNEEFPPVAAWTKADKIGQETKIFRWKKVVDIFKNYCDSDWDYFEDLFTNDFGELLPISAIIAKYETSFSKR